MPRDADERLGAEERLGRLPLHYWPAHKLTRSAPLPWGYLGASWGPDLRVAPPADAGTPVSTRIFACPDALLLAYLTDLTDLLTCAPSGVDVLVSELNFGAGSRWVKAGTTLPEAP